MNDDLARALVECRLFRWMPGMQPAVLDPEDPGEYCYPPRLDSYQSEGMAVPPGAVPDLDDAATAGCLLALLWEHEPGADVFRCQNDDGTWGIGIAHDLEPEYESIGDTLGEAAARALIALSEAPCR